jgi:hypothetical protein
MGSLIELLPFDKQQNLDRRTCVKKNLKLNNPFYNKESNFRTDSGMGTDACELLV